MTIQLEQIIQKLDTVQTTLYAYEADRNMKIRQAIKLLDDLKNQAVANSDNWEMQSILLPDYEKVVEEVKKVLLGDNNGTK